MNRGVNIIRASGMSVGGKSMDAASKDHILTIILANDGDAEDN